MLLPNAEISTSFTKVILATVESTSSLAPPSLSPSFADATSPCVVIGSCPRTVVGILWSCLAVLFTCTWVAVHPNIPRPNKVEQWKGIKQRIGFMLLTLIAPEATLWIAVRQRLAARELVKRHRANGWTMTHAHFALMGGFTLSLPKGSRSGVNHLYNLPDNFDTATFIGQIDEEEIQDRSHSDGLTKVIAIGQTGWFIIQLAARWVQDLPFTELEVMTVAFATINIMTYTFWFKKPLRVQYPIRVQATRDDLEKVKESDSDIKSSPIASPLSRPSSTHSLDNDRELESTPDLDDVDRNISYNHASMPDEEQSEPFLSDLGAGETVPFMELNPISESAALSQPHDSNGNHAPKDRFQEAFMIGWDNVFNNSSEEVLYQDEQDVNEKIEELLKGSDLRFKIYKISLLIPCAVAALFGLIHWIGWISTFPTRTEEITWRISSIVVTFIPVHVELAYKAYAQRHDILLTAPDFLKYVFGIIWYIAPLAYVMARWILIVQSFLTLRDLPCSALQNVEWTDYIPHI
ncbi:uncharacterized protein C8R40DRAFT_1055216 [Lentinula edodes]|uniref:uncharacterized protein n=1 Tax=Lentinula edodes TaxID=5353 RepID=UPI001E8E9541|nr:uncharacterized protein C8R40DRAFT_1055216 [Lentinula edodes]KAH7871098.1 hypothetical protein C8R40DRAFT_1055216 [Lentinula edodes]